MRLRAFRRPGKTYPQLQTTDWRIGGEKKLFRGNYLPIGKHRLLHACASKNVVDAASANWYFADMVVESNTTLGRGRGHPATVRVLIFS